MGRTGFHDTTNTTVKKSQTVKTLIKLFKVSITKMLVRKATWKANENLDINKFHLQF